MGDEDARDLLHRLEEAIANIEREERENFAELVKEAIKSQGYEDDSYDSYLTAIAIMDIINHILRECAED